MRVGTKLSCSKFLAHKPKMNPRREKQNAVIIKNKTAKVRCSILRDTNKKDTARIMKPTTTDFVAEAPT